MILYWSIKQKGQALCIVSSFVLWVMAWKFLNDSVAIFLSAFILSSFQSWLRSLTLLFGRIWWAMVTINNLMVNMIFCHTVTLLCKKNLMNHLMFLSVCKFSSSYVYRIRGSLRDFSENHKQPITMAEWQCFAFQVVSCWVLIVIPRYTQMD